MKTAAAIRQTAMMLAMAAYPLKTVAAIHQTVMTLEMAACPLKTVAAIRQMVMMLAMVACPLTSEEATWLPVVMQMVEEHRTVMVCQIVAAAMSTTVKADFPYQVDMALEEEAASQPVTPVAAMRQMVKEMHQ